MKKTISLLLAFAILFSGVIAVHASEKKKTPIKVKVQAYSNLNSLEKITGMYFDNGFYVTPETICSLTGAELVDSDKRSATFSLFDGLMTLSVDLDDEEEIPLLSYDGQLYISLAHMIRYMGFDVTFASDSSEKLHMAVFRPYTVLDGLAEYLSDSTLQFSWAEAEGIGKPTRYLSALDTVLLSYDPNIFRYSPGIFGVDTVEEEIYLDALYLILQNSGTEYQGSDPWLRVFQAGTEISSYLSDSTDMGKHILKLLGSETAEHYGVLDDVLGVSVFDITSAIAGFSADQIQAMEVYKQYFNISEANKDLLKNSLGRIPSDSPFYDQVPELFEAVKHAQEMVDGAYEVNTLEHAFINGWKTGFSLAAGPYATAWGLLSSLLKNDSITQDLLSKEKSVTYADICADLQIISNSMVRESYHIISGRTDPPAQDIIDSQSQIKSQMIMSLKSTLTTRELLLDTGWLKDTAAAEMEQRCLFSAKLLNRMVNAEVIVPGKTPVVDEDLTWIADLAIGGGLGCAVKYEGNVYYWKYNSESFSDSGTLGYLPYNNQCVNQMVCHGPNGGDTVLFETIGRGNFAIANDRIYYQDFNGIKSCDLDGQDQTLLGSGSLVSITEGGNYLICEGDQGLFSIDTVTNKQSLLAGNAAFIAYWDGVIYYQPYESDSDAAARGQITVSRILPDGTGQADLHTTAPDLYDSSQFYSEAIIGQMYFSEQYIYYSYGSIAGSGMAFQGGKIIRMRYDGSEATVVAGEPELVAGDFIVNEDGSLTTYPYTESKFLYASMVDYEFSNGIAYQYNRSNGVPEPLIYPEDYFMVGTGLAGREGETAIYISQIQRIGNKIYFLAHSLAKENTVWWAGYSRQNSAFLAKDTETGDIEVLYTF